MNGYPRQDPAYTSAQFIYAIFSSTMGTEHIVLIIAFILLLLASAFTSGIETAVFFSNRFHMQNLAGKNYRAKIIARFQETPESFLSVILVGNNIFSIALASISSYLFFTIFGEKGIWYSTACVTVILIVFGEILPKSIAANMPEKIALFFAPPAAIFYKITSPIVKYLSEFIYFIISFIGFKRRKKSKITAEEIQSMFVVAQEEGVLKKERAFLYKNIWNLSGVICREIMIPRSQVVAMNINTPLPLCMKTMNDNKYSRYPVYQGQLNNVIGIVHAKDIMDFWGQEEAFSLKKIMRAPLFVPDIVYIYEVFELLKKRHVHMGCVVDEYGNFEGIVTMEDILEEIVGEIKDEHDFDEEVFIRILSENTVIASGNSSIREVNKLVALDIPEDEITLAGFIFKLLGKIPEKDEEIKYNNLVLAVKSIKGNHIKRVLIKKTTAKTDEII